MLISVSVWPTHPDVFVLELISLCHCLSDVKKVNVCLKSLFICLLHNNYSRAVAGNEILVLRLPPTRLLQNVSKKNACSKNEKSKYGHKTQTSVQVKIRIKQIYIRHNETK